MKDGEKNYSPLAINECGDLGVAVEIYPVKRQSGWVMVYNGFRFDDPEMRWQSIKPEIVGWYIEESCINPHQLALCPCDEERNAPRCAYDRDWDAICDREEEAGRV